MSVQIAQQNIEENMEELTTQQKEQIYYKVYMKHRDFLANNYINFEYEYDFDELKLKYAKLLTYIELEKRRILNNDDEDLTHEECYELSCILEMGTNLSLKIMKSYMKLKDRNHIYKMYGEIFDNRRRNIDIYGFIY